MDLLRRIEKLGLKLKGLACDALLIEDPINLYYLTGLDLSSGSLLVCPEKSFLLVDNRYFELSKKIAPCAVILSDNTPFPEFMALPEFAFIRHLGFDSANTSYRRFQELQKVLSTSKNLTLVPVDAPVNTLRMIKDQEELDFLRQAAILGSQGFDHVCSLLREGIKESEIALELDIFWKRHGGKAFAFEPIIAFGPNSSMPHYRAGNTSLKKGMPVLIDIGVILHHYHSDMTRVVFFGEPDPAIRKIYAIVAKAQKLTLDLCKPGIPIGELDLAARGHIASEGYGDYFKHGLGHGIGLETHEAPPIRNKPPYKDMPLDPGMVITIEPGIYLPGIGGVRIEDTVIITQEGHENLTMRSKEMKVL